MSLQDINSSDFIITEWWGYNASDPSYITLPVPVPTQVGTAINLASFETGFPPDTMTPTASGGLPPFGQDINGVMGMVTANVAVLAAGSMPKFSASRASAIGGYPLGAILLNATGNGYWVCQTANNTNNPDSTGSGNGWQALSVVGAIDIAVAGSDVTLSSDQAAYPFLIFTGTLTANINIIFPVWPGTQWIVANETSGSFTLTCKTASGSGVAIPATGAPAPTSVYCDATNIQNTGVSTAGLAPINSPNLTGTPTTPTASATTNNTQIASTAMVQAAITAALTAYAPKASPTLTGTPAAPTASPGTNTNQLATTAFVEAAVAAALAAQLVRTGTFTCANAGTAIAFSPAFPNGCTSLQLTHASVANGSNIGFAGYNSLSRTGAVCYASINGMQVSYVAIGN